MLTGLSLATAAPAAALEVNTANRAQLEQLQGLGVAMTDRILLAREQALFVDWNDLSRRVPGLRGRRARQLHDQGLTVNGRRLLPEIGVKDEVRKH
jgi:competence protein ComEA